MVEKGKGDLIIYCNNPSAAFGIGPSMNHHHQLQQQQAYGKKLPNVKMKHAAAQIAGTVSYAPPK